MDFLKSGNNRLVLIFVILALCLFGYKYGSSVVESKKDDANFKTTVDKNEKVAKQEVEIPKNQDLDEEKIRTIVKDYIENNPEIIISSLEKMKNKANKDAESYAEKRIQDRMDVINSIIQNSVSFVGSKNSESPVIMFFDYNCGYCKQAGIMANELVSSNPEVKVILYHCPVLGELSVMMSKIAIYAAKNLPEKFQEVHNYFLSSETAFNEQSLREYVFKNNLGNFDDIMNYEYSSEFINSSRELGNYIGINGVPGFIIGNKLIPGLLNIYQIKEMLNKQ